MALFIRDGYTLRHTIPARGPVPALKIEYRPALPERVAQWRRDRAEARTGAEDFDADAALILDQLVRWNAPEPLTRDTLRVLWPQVLTAILDAVNGYTVGEEEGVEKNSPTG